MFGSGSAAFANFLSLQNIFNLLIDNAYLLILGVGMTFVIISGGIDLSVGSMLGFATMMMSSLLEKSNVNLILATLIVLLIGTLLGLFMGYIIQAFNFPLLLLH